MSDRLSERQLDKLPANVAVPQYPRQQVKAGIVHLGVGAFHRAHQAWYTEQVLNRMGGDWGIIGASLRRADVREQLAPQDGLYTVVERDGDRSNYQIVGAIKQVLVAPENPQALIDQLAEPDIKVITLTITEKGYCYDPATEGLRFEHPDVQRDIGQFPEAPITAIGYLAAALAQRSGQGAPGVTLLSCDNLPHNGRILRRVITDFVARAAPALQAWIDANVTFPCSMVDRIVPATTEEDLAALRHTLNVRDEAAVFTEPFSQWVVEDAFIRGAPDWQRAGVLFTDNVAAFETMKLRLLNGSHSLIAYLGFLAGYDYVHEVMANKDFAWLVRAYMDRQAQPTLTIPDGFDIEHYKDQLCQRFANAALNHRTYQIAQDGSQKLPQRWLAAVGELASGQQSTEIAALMVAGWIKYLDGKRDDGEVFTVDDPLVDELQQAVRGEAPCEQVMRINSVFGNMYEAYPSFARSVQAYYRQLRTNGVSETIATMRKLPYL